MTKNEFQAVKTLYCRLAEKGEENRDEKEQVQYIYLDKLLTYINLRGVAINMGNKNPDSNFMVKDAKEKMEEAQKNMHKVMGV